MAQMRDISSSILASEGRDVKTGVLSLYQNQKKGMIKILKFNDYELNPLYWRLVSYASQTYLLGYSKQLPGAKVSKKLLLTGCSTEMNLPEKLLVSGHSNESYLCIQCGEKISFLKADSKRQRNKWVDAIRSAIKEPVYHSSMLSTTSSDSSDSFDVLRDRDPSLPRSVHNTADTAPRPGNDWRRVNTSPAGQFQIPSDRSSVSSIPWSAQALEQERRRTRESARDRTLQSQQSTIHSLNSADRKRYSSQHELSQHGIYDDQGAQYNGIEYNDLSRLKSLNLSTSNSSSQPNLHLPNPVPDHFGTPAGRLYTKRSPKSHYRHSDSGLKAFQQAEGSYGHGGNEPTYHEPGPGEGQDDALPSQSLPDDGNLYMSLLQAYGDDDQSSVSCVNNLGPESGAEPRRSSKGFYLYDDTVSPKLPDRDYQNRTTVAVPKEPMKIIRKMSSKKSRAPQPPVNPPVAPIEQMDSIEREKTVVLETHSGREHHQPGAAREKSTDINEKRLRGEIESDVIREAESLHDYIQRFRSEMFHHDGVTVEVPKINLSRETIELACVSDCICVAALPHAKLHTLLHVDDVIVKVNRQTLPSIDFCYKLFRTTDEKKVQLLVKRVMHGVMCQVILSANGDVDSLGLEFGNQSQGNEVTAMQSEGLVAKSGSPSRPQTHGVMNGGMLVNWGLVEINQTPVSLNSSPSDVRAQLQRAGCELGLVFVPMDIINAFKERSCEERTDQIEGKC